MRATPGAPALRQAEHALEQANVPADEECARSLGAPRFAELHVDVAAARTGRRRFRRRRRGVSRAHACRPRDPTDSRGARRRAVRRARLRRARASRSRRRSRSRPRARELRTASPATSTSSTSAGRMRSRGFATSPRAIRIACRPVTASSCSGSRRCAPASRSPSSSTRTPGEGWPQPLLLFLRGEYTEDELVDPIREGDDDDNTQPNTSTDERLCEALFYVGEAYWARGERDVARDYFAALVNLKVIYFLEHGLALAEIAKLRQQWGHSSRPDLAAAAHDVLVRRRAARRPPARAHESGRSRCRSPLPCRTRRRRRTASRRCAARWRYPPGRGNAAPWRRSR